MPMNSEGIIIFSVDTRAVIDAAIDLRHETLRSIALCQDIMDRLDGGHREPEPERRP
jgi:hypothetical protein